ncbi:MAG: hypothetical protein IKE65_05830 [Clostridia bacterium]|nr:hypothetical protein [Clostridia bacterium]
MFMSALWDTIFEIKDTYQNAEVFLVDNHIPALRYGNAENPVIFAGGFGAEEWQTSVLLLTFFNRLMEHMNTSKSMAGIAVRKAFKKRSVVIIPCVCPPKMRYEGEEVHMKDLSAFTKYMFYHKAGMLVCVSGSGGTIFAPKQAEDSPAQSATIHKILCACSSLTAVQEKQGVAADMCTQMNEKIGLPAYLISPRSIQMAELPQTYKALEETLAVSALL